MKTMKYTRTLQVSSAALADVICAQNLAYFQHYDPRIEQLRPGLCIHRDFYTKTNRKSVRGSSRLSALSMECIQITHEYGKNRIISEYRLNPKESGTQLVYSETSIFEQASLETNYALVSFVYRFFFNRQIKKRFLWLEQQAAGRSGVLKEAV